MKNNSVKLFVLLCVIIFLTSCGINIKNTPNQSVTDSQRDNKNIFYINGELPDIGGFSMNSQRFYEEYTPNFIPSDEYGEILPFIGKSKMYQTSYDDGFYASQIYSSYGFCTFDGKIVCDANENYESIYFTQTDDGFGYYTVRQINDENPEDYDTFEISNTLIIPKSGKWVLELGPRSWLSSAGGGIFSVTEYAEEGDITGVKSYVYDYDKNLLLTLDGIESTGVLSNGLILTTKWLGNGAEYNYVDINGNYVSGPYKRAQDFNEFGISGIADELDDCYLIDVNGKKINDVPYQNIIYESGSYDPYKNNKKRVFVATRKDDNNIKDIYSPDAKLLGTVEGASYLNIRFPDNDDIYYGYTLYDNKTYASIGRVWKRLSDNKLFVSEDLGKCPDEYYGTNNVYVSKDEENSTALIFDYNGKTLANINDYNSYVNLSPNQRYFSYTSGKNSSYYDESKQEYVYNDNTKLNLYDLQKNKILASFDSSGHIEFSRNSKYAIVTLYNDNVVMFSSSGAFLYDTEQNRIMFENAAEIGKLDISGKDYFLVCTPSTNTLYDENLNTIIKTYNE